MLEYVDFPFKTEPYKHQYVTWKRTRDEVRWALFLDMGTGKTKIAIDTAAYLFLNGKIDAVVVFAPKSIYRNWLENEIPKHLPDCVPVRTGYWTSSLRKEDVRQLEAINARFNGLKVFVVNSEAMPSDKCAKFVLKFVREHRVLMVVDESTTIKNPAAVKTRRLIKLGKLAKYRRILSGNPIPNGPLDLWSQAEFLGPDALGFGNYFAFRNRFAVMQDRYGPGGNSFKAVVGYRDTEALSKLMDQFSTVIKKSDCLDLPEKIYQVIDVELEKPQVDMYNTMLDESILELTELGATVTAPIVLTKLVKLHQITCGFIVPDGMDPIPIPGKNHRMEELLRVIEGTGEKIIIWCSYRYNIAQIAAELTRVYGKDSLVEFHGGITSTDARLEAVRRFQDPNSGVRFFLSSTDAGKFGLTLIQSALCLYYSNNYNLESRTQSEDRIHRIGQTRTCIYTDFVVRGTVEEKIMKVLKNKKDLTDDIVRSNWRWLLGEKLECN